MKYSTFKTKLLMLKWKSTYFNIISPPASFKPRFSLFIHENNSVSFTFSHFATTTTTTTTNHRFMYKDLLYIAHTYNIALNLLIKHSE